MKDLLKKWLAAKTSLAAAKTLEMGLRKQLVEAVCQGATEPKAYKEELAGGVLTATIKHNYSLDLAAYEQIERKLSNAEMDAINIKPVLKLKEFKLLDEKSILRKVVIEKPAAPTLNWKKKIPSTPTLKGK